MFVRTVHEGVPGAEESCLSSSHHSSLCPLTFMKAVTLIKWLRARSLLSRVCMQMSDCIIKSLLCVCVCAAQTMKCLANEFGGHCLSHGLIMHFKEEGRMNFFSRMLHDWNPSKKVDVKVSRYCHTSSDSRESFSLRTTPMFLADSWDIMLMLEDMNKEIEA